MIQRQIFEFWGLFGFYQEYCANILCIQIQNEFHHYTIVTRITSHKIGFMLLELFTGVFEILFKKNLIYEDLNAFWVGVVEDRSVLMGLPDGSHGPNGSCGTIVV